MRNIKNEFFDLEIYSIYRALGELIGNKAWEVVWKSGEILFSELEKQLNLKGKKVQEVLTSLAKYLEEAGYVEKIEVLFKAEDELEYKMKNPSIEKCAFRLIKEGFAPPHISTSLLVACLKKLFNLKVELIGDPIKKEGWVIEKWKLSEMN